MNASASFTPLSPAFPRSVEIRNAATGLAALEMLLRKSLATHDLVILRDVEVSDEDIVHLGGRIGHGCSALKKFVAEGSGATVGQSRWHHVGGLVDKRMADATLMTIRKFPASGGGFELVSNRYAWRNLTADEKNRLRSVMVQHDFSAVRHTTAGTDAAPSGGMLPMVGDAQGEPHLILGYHATRIEGMAEAESRSLLDDLMARATRDSSVYRHRWQRGDVIAWRNVPLMHRSLGFDGPGRRAMHEVTIRELRT